MKLKKIKIVNYKQFIGENLIEFNTSGKMTVIYGFNGFGKTRLHSIFYWTLYGADREGELIYNNTLQDKIFDNDHYQVSSNISFTHSGVEYELTREHTYYKRSGRLRLEDQDFKLRYYDDSGNFSRHKEPEKFINQIFPRELSPYFLFDGEGMTNELLQGKKVTNFSKSLKDAVNQLFGLGIYENSLQDLGSETKKLGVIAELNSQKTEVSSEYSPSVLRKIIYANTEKIQNHEEKNKDLIRNKKNTQKEINNLSELIGKSENSKELESKNNFLQSKIHQLREQKFKSYDNLSRQLATKFSLSLVSQNVFDLSDLSEEYYLENSNEYVSRNLVNEILKQRVCVCGDSLDESKQRYLNSILNTLPPISFKHNYTRLKSNAITRVHNIENSIQELEEFDKTLNIYEENIYDNKKEYDQNLEKLKNLQNIRILVSKREELELELTKIDSQIKYNETSISEAKGQVEGASEKLKRLEAASEKNNQIDQKIGIVNQVIKVLELEYEEMKRSQKFSMENSIKDLISKMLTAKREITLNDDFTMSIKTQNNKDSILSAGQSAVVSFSYIGGVLKALKELNYDFISKEYPLILDAPLSHLDDEHISRVFEYLPDFADQIIIFSKEEIDSELSDSNRTIYELRSNEYKNVTSVHMYEGPDYFTDPQRRLINDN